MGNEVKKVYAVTAEDTRYFVVADSKKSARKLINKTRVHMQKSDFVVIRVKGKKPDIIGTQDANVYRGAPIHFKGGEMRLTDEPLKLGDSLDDLEIVKRYLKEADIDLTSEEWGRLNSLTGISIGGH